MKKGSKNYIYKNDLDKGCFQHDVAYGKYKDLTKRTELDKFLRDKAFKIASNPKYGGYETGLVPMICNFFDKKSVLLEDKSAICSAIKPMSYQQLANECHKPITKTFNNRRVYFSSTDNIRFSWYAINKQIK